MATLQDSSRKSWTSNNTIEHINAGSLQRIADATEKMAHNHIQLIEELDRYKGMYHRGLNCQVKLEHQIAGLRGYISRLKKPDKGR